MHRPLRLEACDLQQSGSIINVLDKSLGTGASLDFSGPAHDERHFEGFLVCPAFVKPPMLSQVKSLICTVDHQGVLTELKGIQPIKHTPDIAVHSSHTAEIIPHVTLIFPADEILSHRRILSESLVLSLKGLQVRPFLGRMESGEHLGIAGFIQKHEVTGKVHVLVDAHFVIGGRDAGFIVVEQTCRLRKDPVLIAPNILQAGLPVAVRRLVLNHETERFFSITTFKPIQSQIRDNVC